MIERKCAYCGGLFGQGRITQRFCSRICSDTWFAEERREAVRAYRSPKPLIEATDCGREFGRPIDAGARR